jgi:hypothetical protein
MRRNKRNLDVQTTATLLFVASLLFSVMTTELPAQAGRAKGRKYAAPDGGATAQIWPASKEAGQLEYESKIVFRSDDGNIACTLDYTSEDNQHGFGVVKAEWTADSQYFVFSLTSSGGHQSWHAPTQFLSRGDGTVRTLDDYFTASGISQAEFRLVAPNTIKTEILRDKSIPVSVKLGNLPPLRSWRKSKPFSIACTGGRVFKPGQP